MNVIGERKLRLAANTNDLDRLKSLLDSGIDPKSCDEFLRTALHLAASKGYTEVVRYSTNVDCFPLTFVIFFLSWQIIVTLWC